MLQHGGHVLAHHVEPDGGDGHAAVGDRPALRGVEPQEHLDQGRLAAAARTHQRDLLPRGDGEREVVQDERAVAVAEAHVPHLHPDRRPAGEGVLTVGVARLPLQGEEPVDAPERGVRAEVGVLDPQHLLHRPHHEPEVAEHRHHPADGQVREHHQQHADPAEYLEAGEEGQEGQTVRGVAAPGVAPGVVADLARPLHHPPEVVALAVGGADLLDRVEGLGERLLEDLEGLVLPALELLHAFAQRDREVDHEGVREQDEERERPVHPEEHGGDAHEREHRHQELAHRARDELVERLHVGDEVRGHRAAAERFVLRHRHPLEPPQQVPAHAVGGVLGDGRELARLPDPERGRSHPQGDGHEHHHADVERGAVPGRREEAVEHAHEPPGAPQQHLVHQERHQERDRHRDQRPGERDQVRGDELPAVRERHREERAPGVAVGGGFALLPLARQPVTRQPLARPDPGRILPALLVWHCPFPPRDEHGRLPVSPELTFAAAPLPAAAGTTVAGCRRGPRRGTRANWGVSARAGAWAGVGKPALRLSEVFTEGLQQPSPQIRVSR